MQQEERTLIPEASTSGGDFSIPVKPAGSSLAGKKAAEQQQGSTPKTNVLEAAASSDASSFPKLLESSLSCKDVSVQQEALPITTVPEASSSGLACIIPVEHMGSFPCGKVVPVQQDEGTTMPDASNSGEVLSIPLMPVESFLSRKESTV